MKSKESILLRLVEIIEDILDININTKDYDEPFIVLGLVSSDIPLFIAKVSKHFEIDVKINSVFDSPNINKYAEYLVGELET